MLPSDRQPVPEVEMVPEDDSIPVLGLASGLDVAGDHVIMAIQLERAPKIIGQIVALAAQYELVCFDSQASKVYLLPLLEAKPRRPATAGPACDSGSQPSAIQVNTEPETAAQKVYSPTLAAAFSRNSDTIDVAGNK